MARVSTAAKSVKLGALALPSGRYTLTVYDLTKGLSGTKTIEVRSLDHEEVVEMPGSDAIVVFAPG